MKILKGNFGECRFCDNMDEVNGLPSLDDKSWDLCLTDPPYNINYKISEDMLKNYGSKVKKYSDDIPDYLKFSQDWFDQIQRITQRLIFTPGNKNIGMWYKIQEPVEMFIHYKIDSNSRTSLCRFNRFEPILLYGKYKHLLDFRCNVFDIPLRTENKHRNFFIEHSSPKSFELWETIIKRSRDKHETSSIIDPFLGSGTTAQVCEMLGIPWIGYEIKEEYAVDIEKRIKFGIKQYKNYTPMTQRKLI